MRNLEWHLTKLAQRIFKYYGYQINISNYGDGYQYTFNRVKPPPMGVILTRREKSILAKMEAKRKDKIIQEQIDRLRYAEKRRLEQENNRIELEKQMHYWDEREKKLIAESREAILTRQTINDINAGIKPGDLYAIHGVEPQSGAK